MSVDIEEREAELEILVDLVHKTRLKIGELEDDFSEMSNLCEDHHIHAERMYNNIYIGDDVEVTRLEKEMHKRMAEVMEEADTDYCNLQENIKEYLKVEKETMLAIADLFL